jgi:hypothetical protein
VLSGLDWIGHLEMQDKAEDSRWVLLGETAAMPLVELERRLLLTDSPSLQAYARARMGHSLPVADVLLR